MKKQILFLVLLGCVPYIVGDIDLEIANSSDSLFIVPDMDNSKVANSIKKSKGGYKKLFLPEEGSKRRQLTADSNQISRNSNGYEFIKVGEKDDITLKDSCIIYTQEFEGSLYYNARYRIKLVEGSGTVILNIDTMNYSCKDQNYILFNEDSKKVVLNVSDLVCRPMIPVY